MRSNSLEVIGDLMAVAYQTDKRRDKPAGFDLFDISTPESRGSSRTSTPPASIRAACICSWFVRRRATCTWLPARPTYMPRNPRDDQIYRIIDVRNPSKPVEAGRWWLPGTAEGDAEPPPERHRRSSTAIAVPGAQHQCLPGAAGSLLPRLPRRRRDHPRHQRQVEAAHGSRAGTTRRRSTASRTR